MFPCVTTWASITTKHFFNNKAIASQIIFVFWRVLAPSLAILFTLGVVRTDAGDHGEIAAAGERNPGC